MQVVILATEEQKQEIINGKSVKGKTKLTFIKSIYEIKNYRDFDVFFLLTEDIPAIPNEDFSGKPVIINSVVNTLESLKLPSNFSRINGWTDFLERSPWEIATNNKKITAEVFSSLGWDIIFVKDQPGLVSARVLSMIINEAYFALGEDVSTMDEIDLAMKSGTNYPFGPFEWLDKIGIQNIHSLLMKLSEKNKRYLIAPLLEENFTSSHLQ